MKVQEVESGRFKGGNRREKAMGTGPPIAKGDLVVWEEEEGRV